MKLSAKIEYAYKAVLALAQTGPGGQPVQVGMIADRLELSPKFLLQVMIQLKNAGVIRSVRGASGGYLLTREPGHVTLKEVVQAVDPGFLDGPQPGKAGSGTSGGAEALRDVWREISSQVDEKLGHTDFQTLLLKSQAEGCFVYQI